MKKALLVLAIVAMGASSYAQGIITFYNNGLSRAGLTLTHPATDDPSDPANLYRGGIWRPGTDDPNFSAPPVGAGAGAGYTAGLFLSSNLSTPLATTLFRVNNTFEIFAVAQDVVVNGVAVGQTADFTVRVWETLAGTWDASQIRGEAAFTSGPLGGQIAGSPPAPNATMAGFMGIEMYTVPEPTTMALGMLGLGALMLRRRK